MTRSLSLLLLAALGTSPLALADDKPADWSEQQVAKLPRPEKPVRLFNGKDFDAWDGQIAKHWSVKDGIIIAKNGQDNAPAVSTYLVTKKKYRNFRLIFESQLVTSEMHSGIALWGKTVEKGGDPWSYQGHLVMYPSGYGFWDLYRRNGIYQDKDGVAKKVGKQHDWNRMEILAIGHRIRHVINGTLVADWSDPMPELCEEGPIGLQLHSNNIPQEVQFRGLILTENPEDRFVTAEGSSEPKTAAAPGVDLAKLDAITAKMREFVAAKQIAGAVTLVAHRGKIVHHAAVGEADIDSKRPMQADSLFAIASMTKPIAASAVMILQDEGKLSVDDPVSKYIPEFKDAALASGKPQREVTIRDVLTHTAGLGGSQAVEGSLKQTAENLAKQQLSFEPGTKWQYSPGLNVAGRIVEIVSGKPFDEFLAERIFTPLHMHDTTFFPNAEQQKRVVTLYKLSDDKQKLEPQPNRLLDISTRRPPSPSGGLGSTAADMARFYQMVLNGGHLDGKRILSEDAVRLMTTIQTGGDIVTGFTPGNGWGLGWCVIREPQGVTKSVSAGTFGHGGAFGTQGWVDPKRETIFVLMVQRSNLPNSDASDIRAAFHDLTLAALGNSDKPAETALLDVWPGKVPGEDGTIGEEGLEPQKPGQRMVQRIKNVTKPTLTIFRPAREIDTGAAVVIAPGGGYNILAWDLEGTEVARWLNTIGVTGIVLKYRVPARKDIPRHQAPLQDAQRAMSLVRSKADSLGIDPKRIGMLGFSAGGHLTAVTATNSDKRSYEAIDEVDRVSSRPDFTIIVYPGYLVAKEATDKLVPEIRVDAQSPPSFFAHAGNDPVIPESSVAMYLALKRANVPAELHIFSSGGHGFGLRQSDSPSCTWPARCEAWMRAGGWLKTK